MYNRVFQGILAVAVALVTLAVCTFSHTIVTTSVLYGTILVTRRRRRREKFGECATHCAKVPTGMTFSLTV